MAKINQCSRPEALSELLKRKGMTQMDASATTRVDRKTLLKIDRGEEVKQETLQKVADKLGVPEEYFLPLSVTGDGDVPKQRTIMLRRLDAARLEELLAGAERVEWQLNVKVRDEEARKFLKDFEAAVERFHGELRQEESSRRYYRDLHRFEMTDSLTDSVRARLSLGAQLDRLKIADDIAARLKLFAGHRLALLGADHLFWEYSFYQSCYEEEECYQPDTDRYESCNAVLLSVEPLGTQSRRTPVSIGRPPPLFAPDTECRVLVNGDQLPTREAL
jgi:transcriptional regulator with XRE-family HTH domain